MGRTASRDLLETILYPAHEEHRAMLDWCGGPFEPVLPYPFTHDRLNAGAARLRGAVCAAAFPPNTFRAPDGWMRSQIRRWIPKARALAEGGWRDLVPRHVPEPWRYAPTGGPDA